MVFASIINLSNLVAGLNQQIYNVQIKFSGAWQVQHEQIIVIFVVMLLYLVVTLLPIFLMMAYVITPIPDTVPEWEMWNV